MALREEISANLTSGEALEEVVFFGVNANTLSTDVRAWDMWETVCRSHGTSPLRTAAEARDFPERNAHLLAALMLDGLLAEAARLAAKHLARGRDPCRRRPSAGTGGGEAGASSPRSCAVGEALKPLVVGASGFAYTVEWSLQGNPKPGYVGGVPGAALHLYALPTEASTALRLMHPSYLASSRPFGRCGPLAPPPQRSPRRRRRWSSRSRPCARTASRCSTRSSAGAAPGPCASCAQRGRAKLCRDRGAEGRRVGLLWGVLRMFESVGECLGSSGAFSGTLRHQKPQRTPR